MPRHLFAFFIGLAFFSLSCKDSDKKEDPAPQPEPKEVVSSIKVMTYNIHHANPPSRANVIDLDAITNVIKAEKPDVVALQEVDANTQRSGPGNQAQQLAARLGMQFYFVKSIDYQGGEYGVAILSKYPLTEKTMYMLPTKAGTGGEARVLATAKVTLPDGMVFRFGSTHLDAQSDPANRQLQIEKITDLASQESLPFLIAGDFNATPGSEVINTLDGSFKRTCQACAPTIPAVSPTKAIDFIAYKYPAPKLSVVSHNVVNEQYASDHRPVVAVIGIAK
ncbi:MULTISPECIES: endonuclease/exonuclease/phosphatase family protein [Rufibacter]|uniref:Endonuclease/exonuclease/phosphatase family metal-dependent hydrolase n=1 Tax=Rufibacter quisquiliarum TaxID=1549639 RepID=A0A839GPS0_9BACT|nr:MULTISPECIES: endonuclease/exonuclease/phosphatase family protein [Rufibacter]MBA9076886.1 endonuclease/exonuclease/phosphatase family metal-dependent hydrolase [Rufibacter quisquiliarum]